MDNFLSVYFFAIAFPSLRDSVPHDLSIIIKSLLLVPQDPNLVGGLGAPVIIVAWSLQYEIFFYRIFGFAILGKTALLGLSSLFLSFFVFSECFWSPFYSSFILSQNNLLFLVGIIVSKLTYSNKIRTMNSLRIAFLGFVLFFLAAADTVLLLEIIPYETGLYGLASGLVIFGLTRSEHEGAVILSQRWIQLLGDSSYVLYLIHYPVTSVLCKLAIYFGLNQYGFPGALLTYVVIFSICLISSVIFHLWMEKPLLVILQQAFHVRVGVLSK